MEEVLPIKNCVDDTLHPVRDTLDVLSGKWKILILITTGKGNVRFTTIQKSLGKISPKVLSKELKELEINQLLKRNVEDGYPVMITYSWTDHTASVIPIIESLKYWGQVHRKRLFSQLTTEVKE